MERILKGKEERARFHNLNESSKVAHKKEHETIKCNFCNNVRHLKKDCPKCKVSFEKKGKHCILVCFESNFTKVPHNTW